MAALMLGEKSEFYNNTALYTAMSRAGIMHVVAVSGMHVAFAAGFVQLLFGKTRKSSLFCIGFIWAFAALAGMPYSAVRAALMQTIFLLAPVLRRESSSLRALLAAFIIIELIWPDAILDVGFQLSFGAMLGMMLFSGRLYEAFNFKNRFLQYIGGIISSSLACMVFTVPLTAWHFGCIQILSPITNVLVLFAVSLCFCGGYISVFSYMLSPILGRIIAVPVALVAKYIFAAAELISRIPFAALYTKGTYALAWVALVYALVIIARFSALSPKGRLALPLVLSCVSLCALLLCVKESYEGYEGVFSVIDIGQGQCISVMSGDKTLLVDCGGDNRAGSEAGSYLLSCGRAEVDLLVLTHLHTDHINGLEALLEYVDVKEIVLPEYGDNNQYYLEDIRQLSASKGIILSFVEKDSYAQIGNIHCLLYAPEQGNEVNEACLITRISIGEYDLLITGDSGSSTELEFIEKYDSSGIEFLIAGHHGSKKSSCREFLQSIEPDAVIISTGENTYGHPTQETLNRIKAINCALYRTDLNGTVEIRIN